MKMKEKKTEEVVEEVVNSTKISDELKEYLELARFCEYQKQIFYESGMSWLNEMDNFLNDFGIDVSKPVSIITYIPENEKLEKFDQFIQSWIDAYNRLDVTKLDNYTKRILTHFVPNPFSVSYIRKEIKRCAQHTTEE